MKISSGDGVVVCLEMSDRVEFTDTGVTFNCPDGYQEFTGGKFRT